MKRITWSMRTPVAFVLAAVAGVVFAEGVASEDDLVLSTDRASGALSGQELNLSDVWALTSLADEQLAGLRYSSTGWGCRTVAEGATVRIAAVSGILTDGGFVADGAAATLVDGLTGDGTYDWVPQGVAKRVYRLMHEVSVDGKPKAEETLYCYFDFSSCVIQATAAEVAAAVCGEVSHAMKISNDVDHPWQPIDGAGSGLLPEKNLAAGMETTISFAFTGIGEFSFSYRLTGGGLTVTLDGAEPVELTANDDWTAFGPLTFETFGAHTAVFAFTSAADADAAIKDVVWCRPEQASVAQAAATDKAMDLREGVRVIRGFGELLPFVYSPTNFTGLAGVADASIACVKVVQLTGTGPDLSLWSEEVPGTARELVRSASDGTVVWNGRNGVWKATFDILDGETSVHTESAVFDMRRFGLGFMILLR